MGLDVVAIVSRNFSSKISTVLDSYWMNAKKAYLPFAFQTLHILCITEIQRPLSCSNVLKATPRLSGPKFEEKNYCVTVY